MFCRDIRPGPLLPTSAVRPSTIRHSIVAGNTLNGSAEDLFTGSVLHFYSHGYNLLGKIDFRQILVPIPPWMSLSRKHWPKEGDADNVAVTDILDLPGAVRHASIVSVGTDNGLPAVLWYPPKGIALDRIPAGGYTVENVVMAEYRTISGRKDDFLSWILSCLSTGDHGGVLGSGFGASYRAWFESTYGMPLDNVAWYESPASWPSDPRNDPIPDFKGSDAALAIVVDARPDILNHNLETVERLYRIARPGGRYPRALRLLRRAREMAPDGLTKSGIICGLGEEWDELLVPMRDLREQGVDILTLGQYLRPTGGHLPLAHFYTSDEFAELRRLGMAMGYRHVESGPLVRSSYHAWEQVQQAEAAT